MFQFTAFLARGFRTQTYRASHQIPFPLTLGFKARSRLHSSPRLSIPYHPNVKRAMQRPALLFKVAGVAGIGLGLSNFMPKVHCDVKATPPTAVHATSSAPDLPPIPASSVSLYQLSFGTVAGICAGVFIKKGAKAAAWFLGGIFVLLQYLGSTSVVRIDWGRMASRFESAFYTSDATGSQRAPTLVSLWTWLVDFLTADFQPRASFIAGFVLGLRIG